jgi:hypothetical protein
MGRRRRSASWNVNDVFERDLRAPGGGARMAFLLQLVARHTWFVDPRVASAVPTVFPRTARGRLGAYRTGQEKGGITYWENQPAKYAFFAAIGSTQRDFTNFNVCHVWPGSTGDPRHFTRLANLAVVPRTLWRFTDWGPVQENLQRRSFELCGFAGPRGKKPARPGDYPDAWLEPVVANDPEAVVKYLRRLRATSPRFKELPGSLPPRSVPPDLARTAQRWAPAEWLPNFEAQGERYKRPGARDLDREAWGQWAAEGRTLAAFRSWIVRHSYFANLHVARVIDNPFPKCRRLKLGAGERAGRVVDGITLASNTAAADSLLLAIQKPIRTSLGGNVNHAWQNAPQLPAHFCNIRGLVLVPAALSSMVDAQPLRAMLKRQLFERTGYTGPEGERPPKPSGFPHRWPETMELTGAQVERAIRMLERYRRERPGYYRRPP